MAGIDIISDSTGKEIVAAIQSTDVTQARILEINTAAEAKKNEVLESIPEDYTNLNNDVSELKGDLVNLNDDVGEIAMVEKNPNIEFDYGTLTWNSTKNKYEWNNKDKKRLSAKLKTLELNQGDSIGLKSSLYDKYMIAFGDNDYSEHVGGWYANGYNSSDIIANDTNILPYVFLCKKKDDTEFTKSDIDEIIKGFHVSNGAYALNVSVVKASEKLITNINKRIEKSKNPFLHMSFDDCSICIKNLQNVSSLWEEPFFNMLKTIHDKYNTVFSLYVWNVNDLLDIPSRFKDEFISSSDWLKFGFHALNEGSLETATYDDAKQYYELFVNKIYDICGGINSIDRMPRLNYFKGSIYACEGLRDANCGCIGFLNTDDTRNAYYLNETTLSYLRNHSIFTDLDNGLQFMSTVMRLDWFVSGFTSQYDYNVPVKDNPYDELVYRYSQSNFGDLYYNLVVFTHEWQVYSSSCVINAQMLDRIEQVAKFGYDYNYDNDYPQNRVTDIRSFSKNDSLTSMAFEWKFGAIEFSGGFVTSETRIRTNALRAKNLKVYVPYGYKINVVRYASESDVGVTSEWRSDWIQDSLIEYDTPGYYVIVISKINNTVEISDGDKFKIKSVIIY